MWLALTATVFGWRTFSGHDVLSGTPLAIGPPLAGAPGDRAASPGWPLPMRVGRLLPADLRTKYLPVAQAFRLVLRAGPRFLGAFLVLTATVAAGQRFTELGVDCVIGPQAQAAYLARMAFTDLAVSLLFTTRPRLCTSRPSTASWRQVSCCPDHLRLAAFRCVHRKADEEGIPGRISTEENAARCVPGRRETSRDLGNAALTSELDQPLLRPQPVRKRTCGAASWGIVNATPTGIGRFSRSGFSSVPPQTGASGRSAS